MHVCISVCTYYKYKSLKTDPTASILDMHDQKTKKIS